MPTLAAEGSLRRILVGATWAGHAQRGIRRPEMEASMLGQWVQKEHRRDPLPLKMERLRTSAEQASRP